MPSTDRSEAEIAECVVVWLRALGWETYHEVPFYGRYADIVATKDSQVWIIEAKTKLNMQLIEQADKWLAHANIVSVATPLTQMRGQGYIGNRILRKFGIGRLAIDGDAVRRLVEPVETPDILAWADIRTVLSPDLQVCRPGATSVERLSTVANGPSEAGQIVWPRG